MDIREGDWVRTSTGKEGKVILVSRLAAFVETDPKHAGGMITALLSELTKIEPPADKLI